MKLHRFFVGKDVELTHKMWLHDVKILHQWRKVLRFEIGREVVLFDGAGNDRLYKITKLDDSEAGLELVTELEPVNPKREVYLLWSLLKKDKNEWVLQKCTELGVTHFVPILADRSEKLGFDVERAQKIVTEAIEQCGRSELPKIREPLSLSSAIEQVSAHATVLVCEQATNVIDVRSIEGPIAVVVGPEGGWSDAEKELFTQKTLQHFVLSDFTLRAETACVAVSATLGL